VNGGCYHVSKFEDISSPLKDPYFGYYENQPGCLFEVFFTFSFDRAIEGA